MPLVILGTVGNFSFSQCRGSLNRGAVYIASDQLHNLLFSVNNVADRVTRGRGAGHATRSFLCSGQTMV